jgi:hypothetical protein
VNTFSRKSIEHLATGERFRVRASGFGSQHLDLDFGSAKLLKASVRSWGVRLAKDLYNHVGLGIGDSSSYTMRRITA